MSVNQGSGSPIGGGNSIWKGVVTDVVFDPSSPGSSANSIANLANVGKLSDCPANTCIVQLYGQGTNSMSVVAYPFFPPHISVPVKPGEAVWVICPALGTVDPNDCYWVCKIATANNFEDTNFSHPFRDVKGDTSTSGIRTSEKSKMDPANVPVVTLPGFPNDTGGGTILPASDPDTNPFDKTLKSDAVNLLCREPTPPFYKRPGDLVLQGSNNAIVCLGQDRGYAVDLMSKGVLTGSFYEKPKEYSGTIDIVAGRSRYLPSASNATFQSGYPGRTSIPTIENTRSLTERDMAKRSSLDGDVDFAVDASRVYVSMLTDGDYNFGLLNHVSASVDRMPASIVTGSIQPASGSGYIIAKSDEIRLVARRQLENEYYGGNPEINGSIKIIKEGKKDGDLAAVILQPDGSIQISGSRIFLGRHPDDGGLEESEAGPDDATHVQPYVRYQQLEDLLNAILDDLNDMCTVFQDAAQQKTPGYGAPNPGLIAAGKKLETAISARRDEIVNLKSTRIFGE